MKRQMIAAKRTNSDEGYVLVGAMLILLLLVIIGIAGLTSTDLEIKMAASDRTHKETFYTADGGTHVGAELIEQSIWDFPTVTLPVDADGHAYLGNLYVANDYKQLFLNPDVDIDGTKTPLNTNDDVVLANRDAYFNYGVADPAGITIPRTDIQIGGHAVNNEGGNLVQLAGYEGKGKGSAGGGIARLYEIHSISYGNNGSETWLIVQWRHVL